MNTTRPIIATILGGDGVKTNQGTLPLAQDMASRVKAQLWNPVVIADLEFHRNPTIGNAIELMQSMGGETVEMIGEPIYSIIFHVKDRGFFVYSEITKRFYNKDGSISPEALKSCRLFEEERRIGIYVGPVKDNPTLEVFLFVDFALKQKPIQKEGKEYAYCACNDTGIIEYAMSYKQN